MDGAECEVCHSDACDFATCPVCGAVMCEACQVRVGHGFVVCKTCSMAALMFAEDEP